MRATIRGIGMNYETAGDGPSVLWIHGFPLSGAMWRAAVAALNSEFRSIVPDLRGFGGSDATAEVTMGDFAEDLGGLLDHLNIREPAAVVGMSMGGYVALEFFRRFPTRVCALVLVDSRGEADAAEAAKARLATAEKVLRDGSGVVADAMVEKLFAPEAPASLKEEWRRAMAAASPRGVAAALRAMAGRVDSFATLHAMRIPALIVVGEKDAITPPDCAERMHRAVRGSHMVIIPGAGHMTPVEQPEAFHGALRSFLRGVPWNKAS